MYYNEEIKWHRVRAERLKISQWNIMSSAIKEKRCRFALKLMKPFSFHCCSPFFLGCYCLLLLASLLSCLFYCCSAYQCIVCWLIVPSITFIEPFWFLDWNKSLSNQSIRAVSIPNYLCEWWFSFASTKLPQVMNMSTWFVFIQWIDNNMSCLRH